MKKIILFLIFSFAAFQLSAQQVDVTLHIVDGNGKPLKEVRVNMPGFQAPILSDESGVVKFAAAKGSEVTVSKSNEYLRTIKVSSDNMTVALDENSRIYNIGYNQFVTKELSSASIDGIGYDEIKNSTQTQVLNALYGMIPGLEIYQNGSGAYPDDTYPSINVRGRGSYSGNSVLVLVDGIPRDASYIDVDEVESVSVLKDAASLALYGIRGADGAILVTTKRGGDHRFNISSGYSFGVQTPFRVPEMASPTEYANALNEARSNDGLSPYFSSSDVASIANNSSTVIPTVDWRKMILRNIGFNNDAHLSLDGSTRMAKYFVYADYRSNRGFFKNTGILDGLSTQNAYDALKLRTNLDIVITPTTDVLVNLAARIQQKSGPISGLNLKSMYTTPTVGFPVKYDEIWCRSTLFSNPVQDILGSGTKVDFARRLSADMTIRQSLESLVKGLKAEARIAYDNSADINDDKTFDYTYYNFAPIYDTAGNLSDYSLSQFGNDTGMSFSSYLSTQFMHMSVWGKLGWERNFGEHHINAAFVFNRDKRSYTWANNSFIHHDFILGGNYDYAGKYLATLSASYSASSLMPKGDKFRFYPAISLGWIISKEDFMENVSFVDFLKLRGSFGLVGMDSNLSYDMDKQFNGGGLGYIFVSPTVSAGQTEGSLPSTGVEPELDHKADVGLEFALFHGLTGEIDGFYNKRTNLRTKADNTTSEIIGIGQSDAFNGETTNYGAEFSLGWKQNIGDYSYFIKGNVSWARNKITKIDETYQPYSYLYQQGTKIGQFYGLVADGYYQVSDFDASGNLISGLPTNTFASVQPGDVKYKDLNGDNKIDNYDYTYQLKTNLPELYYGLQLGLNWKGLGFNAWFQGVSQYTIQTTLASVYQPLYGGNKNISKHYLDSYWTASNPQGRYPRLTTLDNSNNYLSSDLWTEDGGFLKLRELDIYYTLPQKITERWKLGEVKVSLRGNNLFSADNVGIFDPEAVNYNYPTARTYSIGLNVTF